MKPNTHPVMAFFVKLYTYIRTLLILRKISRYLKRERLDPTKRTLLETQYEMAFMTLGIIGWKHPQKNRKLLSSKENSIFDRLGEDDFNSLLRRASDGAMVEREGLDKF